MDYNSKIYAERVAEHTAITGPALFFLGFGVALLLMTAIRSLSNLSEISKPGKL